MALKEKVFAGWLNRLSHAAAMGERTLLALGRSGQRWRGYLADVVQES